MALRTACSAAAESPLATAARACLTLVRACVRNARLWMRLRCDWRARFFADLVLAKMTSPVSSLCWSSIVAHASSTVQGRFPCAGCWRPCAVPSDENVLGARRGRRAPRGTPAGLVGRNPSRTRRGRRAPRGEGEGFDRRPREGRLLIFSMRTLEAAGQAAGRGPPMGRVKPKRLPPSGLASTQMRPPCASTASLEKASPSPDPSRRPLTPGT